MNEISEKEGDAPLRAALNLEGSVAAGCRSRAGGESPVGEERTVYGRVMAV